MIDLRALSSVDDHFGCCACCRAACKVIPDLAYCDSCFAKSTDIGMIADPARRLLAERD